MKFDYLAVAFGIREVQRAIDNSIFLDETDGLAAIDWTARIANRQVNSYRESSNLIKNQVL